jgi:DNA-directed RNA polymerase sigma subunit (sigma70/sigma32)
MTLTEIADSMGVTYQRVQQMHHEALELMRNKRAVNQTHDQLKSELGGNYAKQ